MNNYFAKARDQAEEAERLIREATKWDGSDEDRNVITTAQVHATLANAYAILAAGRGG